MFANELTQLGLSPEESAVYEVLIGAKQLSASQILEKIPYKKGNLYNILAELEEKGLVIKSDKVRNATFEAAHPNRVLELIERKDQELHKAKVTIEAALPQILSTYNLHHSKPGVRFFEGEAGMKAAAYDSLTAKSEILSYVDLGALQGHKLLEDDYVKKRDRLGIKKRWLTADIPFVYQDAKSYDWTNTDIRLMPADIDLGYTVLQIYDDKINYVTLEKGKLIAVIIEDKNITTMQKTLFELIWKNAKPLKPLLEQSAQAE